jgi:polyhydroxyalkanoate synthase
MDVKPPVHVPEGDKRFADPAWSENPAFFAVRQGYLAARAGDLAGDAKARLATGFLLDALAPESSTRPARRPGPRRPTT